MTTSSSPAPHVDHVETLAEGQWVTLQKVRWTDSAGCQREWERCCRTSQSRRRILLSNGEQLVVPKPPSINPGAVAKPDATSVLALGYHKNKYNPGVSLLQGDDVDIILIKQYRPPLCAYSLEFPAGLIDEDEDAVAAGKRELKEETGFTAERIVHVSPQLSLSPGSSTESSVVIVAVVNFDDPINQNCVQQLDESEEIEVKRIPLKSMMEEFDRFKKSGGIIFEEVYMVALGFLFLSDLKL